MSERAPAPGSSGDKPNGEPGALDDEREAALMREVLREQEQHREGGVEPGLDDPDTQPGPAPNLRPRAGADAGWQPPAAR